LHGRPPLGKHLLVNAMDPSAAKMVDREIVGVINQVKVEGLGEKENAAEIYVPIAQNPWYGASLAIGTKGDPFSLLHAVKAVIARHDPELPVTEVRSMDDIAYESIAEPRFRARLLGSFAGLALSLSGLGVFGVLAFSVTQRRREFGVRMALGAQLRDVFALVLQQAGIILGLGLAIGILGAAASTRSMSALLYGVSPLDAASFMAAPAVLTLVVLAATCIPALRAMRTNPAVVLRHE
jgi:putative ABC transport system permease protein